MKNILLILTDQQRKDSLGCYGNTVTATPNLDRLAARGVRYERNYVANQICMPNRLSLMTGENIRSHGLWTNGLLLDERRTLAHHLADQGYDTASIGKIHFTPFGGDGGNRESMQFWREHPEETVWHGPYWGFDHVELALGHTSPLAHYGEWFYRNGGTDEMLERHPRTEGSQSGVRDLPSKLHDSAWVAERSLEYMNRNKNSDKPFFLVASFPDPHHPFDPPREVAAKYPPECALDPVGSPEDLATRPEHYRQQFEGAWGRWGVNDPKHPDGLDETHSKDRIALTYAMVDLIDQNVGKILDGLNEMGLADDTIVVFTSDHGELLGDHGLWAKGPFFYECLINTPLIIAAPDGAKGEVCDSLISALDLAPTLCDLAGAEGLPFANGVSQANTLHDPTTKNGDHCLVEYRNGYGENDVASVAYVTQHKKYIRYQNGDEEYTNLQADPEERRNLAADDKHEGECRELAEALLDAYLASQKKGPEQICHA